MDIKSLIYITAIAEEKSLSGAARKLHISQPTLSVYLSGLETSLGTDLFFRVRKQLIPTPAGRLYIDAARKIISIHDQTYQSIHRISHAQRETVIVGASPFRGSVIMAQIFPQFSRRFPDVKIEIRESYMQDLWETTRNRRVNFSLVSYCSTENPAFDYITISREELVLGVPAFHRLAYLAERGASALTAMNIREFADTPFVLLARGTTVRAVSDQIFSRAGLVPTVVFETNNLLVLSHMIRQGAGAGIMPRSSMDVPSDDMVYFSLTPRSYANLGIIMPKGHRMTEAERYLAYLVIRKDLENPVYTSAMNSAARCLWDEFSEKEPFV